MNVKLYQKIASDLRRLENSYQSIADSGFDSIESIERELLPSGSGFDSGSKIVPDTVYKNRIIIKTAFHHMNDVGYYVRWTYHTITITPCLDHTGFNMRITGQNYNNIKEYICDTFTCVLNMDVEL